MGLLAKNTEYLERKVVAYLLTLWLSTTKRKFIPITGREGP